MRAYIDLGCKEEAEVGDRVAVVEFGWWKTFTVRIRRSIDMDVKPEAEQLEGNTYLFRYGGMQGDDDKYPGELMWIPADRSYPKDGPMWIASGDLVKACIREFWTERGSSA